MRTAVTLTCLLALAACQRHAESGETPPAETPPLAAEPAPAPEPAPTPPPASAPSFVDIDWRADTGSGVEIGTVYTFRGDGTLTIDAPNGEPMTGAWRQEGDGLVMVEEGIEYATDIVAQDADHLHLRSHNPGGTVELMLVRETQATPQ